MQTRVTSANAVRAIALSNLTVTGPGTTGCATSFDYTVNGLKGGPKTQFSVTGSALNETNGGHPEGQLDTVTSADNGIPQSLSYPDGYVGGALAGDTNGELWRVTLRLYDSKGKQLSISSGTIRTDNGCNVLP